jgi:hypothetical protein
MKSKYIINCVICSKPVNETRNYHYACLSNKDKLKFKPKVLQKLEQSEKSEQSEQPKKKIQIINDTCLIKTSYDLKDTTVYL